MNRTEKHRTHRMFLPVRVLVTGRNSTGTPFREETVGVSLDRGGVRVSLPRSVCPKGEVRIKNLQTGVERSFRVAGRPLQVFGECAEWDMAPAAPAICSLEVESAVSHVNTQPGAMLRCTLCRDTQLNPLSSLEYEALLRTGTTTRRCERCGEATAWEPSVRSSEAAPVTTGGPDRPLREQRTERRLRLMMLLSIRDAGGNSEVVQTEDVSPSGLCFVSWRAYPLGEAVYLTLPSAAGIPPHVVKGQIVWSRPTSYGRIYGVKYL